MTMTTTTIMTMITHMKKFTKISLAVVSFLIAASLTFVLIYTSQLKPVMSDSSPIVFKVDAGETSNSVIDKLGNEGIIRSSMMTKLQARLSGKRSVFEGYFELDKSWSSEEILNYITNPNNAAPMEATVTLVEGSWAKDMAAEIEKYVDVKKEDLLDLWNNKEYIQELMNKYEFLPKEILDNDHAKVYLEGFLYPDTYTFRVDSDIRTVTELILNNSMRYYETYKEALSNSSFSMYELMTLASIVEYEANTQEDMEKVAGVFMNRLNQGMRLESSVTVCYALYDFDSWEECERKSPESPYNTYRNPGLTPGPILNPSVKAINATLNYGHHDYLFFIADVHGDGSVHYQKTYAEHEVVRKQLLGY